MSMICVSVRSLGLDTVVYNIGIEVTAHANGWGCHTPSHEHLDFRESPQHVCGMENLPQIHTAGDSASDAEFVSCS